jgi:hypothetical protein
LLSIFLVIFQPRNFGTTISYFGTVSEWSKA